jgi:hypothetical protein
MRADVVRRGAGQQDGGGMMCRWMQSGMMQTDVTHGGVTQVA